jgi:hypothetical protein
MNVKPLPEFLMEAIPGSELIHYAKASWQIELIWAEFTIETQENG